MITTPQDILDIKNPFVRLEIQAWKEGHISWDQALMNAVLNLTKNNELMASGSRHGLVEAAREAVALGEDHDPAPAKIASNYPLDTVKGRVAYFEAHGFWPEDPRARRQE